MAFLTHSTHQAGPDSEARNALKLAALPMGSGHCSLRPLLDGDRDQRTLGKVSNILYYIAQAETDPEACSVQHICIVHMHMHMHSTGAYGSQTLTCTTKIFHL